LEARLRLRIIEAAYRRFGARALAQHRPWLSPQILAIDHVTAAELLLALGESARAARHLERALAGPVDAEQASTVVHLVRTLAAPSIRDDVIDDLLRTWPQGYPSSDRRQATSPEVSAAIGG
jgi:hypothetical protein